MWAQVPPGESNFNGPAIFIAEVAKDAEDPDDYEDNATFVPSNSFDGIVGSGWSGGSASQFGGTPQTLRRLAPADRCESQLLDGEPP